MEFKKSLLHTYKWTLKKYCLSNLKNQIWSLKFCTFSFSTWPQNWVHTSSGSHHLKNAKHTGPYRPAYVVCSTYVIYSAHHLGISYCVNFLGRLGSNGFQLIWRFGTHGNLKKSKSLGPFWSYQLNSTANSAHLAQF